MWLNKIGVAPPCPRSSKIILRKFTVGRSAKILVLENLALYGSLVSAGNKTTEVFVSHDTDRADPWSCTKRGDRTWCKIVSITDTK